MKKLKHIFLILMVAPALFIFSCKKDDASTNNESTDSGARDFLTASRYTKLIIEIQYMPGFKPEDATVNNLVSFLNAYINKPGGIIVQQKQIASHSGQPLSVNDVKTIEDANRTAFNSGNILCAYVLFTDGGYSGGSQVLGIAYGNTSAVIFGKTIHDNSGGIGQTSRVKLESTVTEHEFGHLLGLVDNGSPMIQNHIDAQNGKHCNTNNCLMYYASETTEILGFLITGDIPVPDANCKADLKANGGK